MKITKVEAFAVQAKPTDRQAYWGSRTWGESGKVRAYGNFLRIPDSFATTIYLLANDRHLPRQNYH